MIVDEIRRDEMPFTVWVEVLFTNAFVDIFCLRPDGQIAFGGEFVLLVEEAGPDFDLQFHLAIHIEDAHFMPGEWHLLVKAESGECVRTVLRVLP